MPIYLEKNMFPARTQTGEVQRDDAAVEEERRRVQRVRQGITWRGGAAGNSLVHGTHSPGVSTGGTELVSREMGDSPTFAVQACQACHIPRNLDLMSHSSLIFFESGYSLHTLRQASRRSWRIGQRQSVRVFRWEEHTSEL